MDPLGSSFARLVVRQKDAGLSNGYVIRPVDGAGKEGEPLAFAKQKMITTHKQVSFFADEARTQPLFGFLARQAIETYTVYDVTDAAGEQLAWFKKEFRPSITRSTWTLSVTATGIVCTARERRLPMALARRAWNVVLKDYLRAPLPFHFDLRTADGTLVMTSQVRRSVRDIYDIELPELPDGSRLDWRVAAAMGAALDVLELR